MPSLSFLMMPFSLQCLRADIRSGLEDRQAFQVHDRIFLTEDIVKAPLGKAPVQRHLAAFKAGTDRGSGAGLLPFVAARRGLAVAGADAAPDALRLPIGASGRF